MQGKVLIVAGSDSGGGAGIQGDIKTVTCMNGYAMTALTALTAQNSNSVSGIYEISEEFVRLQMETVLEDFGADCIKLGMMYNAEIIKAVAQCLNERATGIPIILDPVLTSKSGTTLLKKDAIKAMIEHLIPIASLITPNIPETAVITHSSVKDENDMLQAGRKMLKMGAKAVLLKGGHADNQETGMITDAYITPNRHEFLRAMRIVSTDTHGTGCTLSSAIATSVAQGISMRQSILRGRSYVQRAIRRAPGLGSGHGPLDHAHTVRTDWE